MRAWEAAYGASYEEAVAASGQNGRGALNGKSSILTMATGNGTPPTPPTLLTASGLESFVLRPVLFPPNIVCPVDFSTNQPIVTYTLLLIKGAAPAVSCLPPSGSSFPVGRNVIVCTASNAGGTSQCSFRITVADTEPPVINCPATIKVEFRDAHGAQATFAPTAIDTQDGAVLVSCLPPSGAVFPIGTNTVVCSATDASANTSSCRFNVIVLGSRAVIEDVLADLTFSIQGADPLERRWLNKAIGRLNLSLIPAVWIDQTHLAAKHVHQVFVNLNSAVQDLRDIMRHEQGSPQLPLWKALGNRLIKAEQLLASTQQQNNPKEGRKDEESR